MTHVLLVGAEPVSRQVLRATVRFGGFTCFEAISGAQALRFIENQWFDAVLFDLDLPNLAGAPLIAYIRAESDVPLIVLSSKANEAAIIAALDAGADCFLAKPFMPGELLARIRALIRRYDLSHGQSARSPPARFLSDAFDAAEQATDVAARPV